VLDWVAPALVGICILGAAAGSSIQQDLLRIGMPARWILIAGLLLVAIVRAALAVPSWRFPHPAAAALLAFCGLGLVSVSWSVHARGTLQRVVAELVVFTAIGLLAGVAALRPSLATRLLDAVLAAATVVAVAGFLYWLVEPAGGAVAASAEYPSRYRGIEENANTAALLLAIAMPLALARSLRARTTAARVAFALLVLAFAASISAAGSRGGLVGGFFGLLVVTALAPLERRARLGLAAAVVAALALSAWAITIPSPLPASAAAAAATPRTADRATPRRPSRSARRSATRGGRTGAAHPAEPVRHERAAPCVARDDRPSARAAAARLRLRRRAVGVRQSLLRVQLGKSGERLRGHLPPDRLHRPRAVPGRLALCVVPGVRRPHATPWLVAALGAAGAGLAMGISQSFFHGPGGIAYVAFWTVMLLSAAGAARRATT
jgi:hypothetical protein